MILLDVELTLEECFVLKNVLTIKGDKAATDSYKLWELEGVEEEVKGYCGLIHRVCNKVCDLIDLRIEQEFGGNAND